MRMRASLGVLAALWASSVLAQFVAEPQRVVLGRTPEVTLNLTVPVAPDDETRRLFISANVGAVDRIERVGPGRFRARYTPPSTRYPQVAMLAVWRDAKAADVQLFRLPLLGVARVPVKTGALAQVKVQVAGVDFGPVSADHQGDATVPIEAPPGVREATVIATLLGRTTTSVVPLEVPPYNRLVAAAVPPAVVTGSGGLARVEVFYDGEAATGPEALRYSATAGTLRLERSERARWVLRYAAPRSHPEPVAMVSVSVAGDPTSQMTIPVRLGLPDPAKVVLRTPPEPVMPGAATDVEVMVLGEDQLGISGHVVTLRSGDGEVAMSDAGGGRYSALVEVPPTAKHSWPLTAAVAAPGGPLTARGALELATPAAPRGILFGVRAGAGRLFTAGFGLQLSAELLVPLLRDGEPLELFGVHPFVAGVAGYGYSSQRISPAAGPATTTRASWWPVSLRAGAERRILPGLRVEGGVGLTFGYAQVSTSLTGVGSDGWGIGGGLFAGVRYRLGPGHLVGQLEYGWAPVSGPTFRGDLAGLALSAGYRMMVF